VITGSLANEHSRVCSAAETDKGSTEIFASNSEKSGSGHGSRVAARRKRDGWVWSRRLCGSVRANLVVKSNSRETHFRVVLVYKLLVTLSLLELGPVIFGGTEAIVSYFRAQTSCHKLHLH